MIPDALSIQLHSSTTDQDGFFQMMQLSEEVVLEKQNLIWFRSYWPVGAT